MATAPTREQYNTLAMMHRASHVLACLTRARCAAQWLAHQQWDRGSQEIADNLLDVDMWATPEQAAALTTLREQLTLGELTKPTGDDWAYIIDRPIRLAIEAIEAWMERAVATTYSAIRDAEIDAEGDCQAP